MPNRNNCILLIAAPGEDEVLPSKRPRKKKKLADDEEDPDESSRRHSGDGAFIDDTPDASPSHQLSQPLTLEASSRLLVCLPACPLILHDLGSLHRNLHRPSAAFAGDRAALQAGDDKGDRGGAAARGGAGGSVYSTNHGRRGAARPAAVGRKLEARRSVCACHGKTLQSTGLLLSPVRTLHAATPSAQPIRQTTTQSDMIP
jgi:hypothetical protein